MVSRTLSSSAIAVLAGAAMLAMSSGPSSAFTLASALAPAPRRGRQHRARVLASLGLRTIGVGTTGIQPPGAGIIGTTGTNLTLVDDRKPGPLKPRDFSPAPLS